MKWLAVATVVIVGALLVLWHEARTPTSPAAAAPTAAPAPAPRRSANLGPPVQVVGAIDGDAPLPPDVRPAGTLAPEDDPGPIKKFSDLFWERIDETFSRRLLGYAADCYEGGKDRKQKLKVGFRYEIKGGKVSVHDVRVVESTLGDAALESCMVKAVSGAVFEDKNMPDWESSAEDEEMLLIRISTLKRFGPPSD